MVVIAEEATEGQYTLVATLAAMELMSLHTRAAPGSGSGHSSDSGYNNDSVHVDGYTRKDGTHVAPYTRSAPGSGEGDSNQPVDSQPLSKPSSRYSDELVDSQPVSKPSSVPLNNSDNRSAKSLSQAVNTPARFEFPKPTCGDKPTGNNDTSYPVFFDGVLAALTKTQLVALTRARVRKHRQN